MTQRARVSLVRFHGTCANGHTFITHDIGDFDYGRRVARTVDPGDMGFVDALQSRWFDEIAGTTKEVLTLMGKARWYSRCFDAVFGVLCDPSPSGRRYDLAERPRCPECGTNKLAKYGPTEPPVVDLLELPLVSYQQWSELGAHEKRLRVVQALRDTMPDLPDE
jgi:hypothetical protein